MSRDGQNQQARYIEETEKMVEDRQKIDFYLKRCVSDRQIDTDRQIDGRIDRQIEIDRQIDRQIDR